MILNFKSQEHAEEWTQFFSKKLDEQVMLHQEVASRFFNVGDLKDFSPEGLHFINSIVHSLTCECNEFVKNNHSDQYEQTKSTLLTEEN